MPSVCSPIAPWRGCFTRAKIIRCSCRGAEEAESWWRLDELLAEINRGDRQDRSGLDFVAHAAALFAGIESPPALDTWPIAPPSSDTSPRWIEMVVGIEIESRTILRMLQNQDAVYRLPKHVGTTLDGTSASPFRSGRGPETPMRSLADLETNDALKWPCTRAGSGMRRLPPEEQGRYEIGSADSTSTTFVRAFWPVTIRTLRRGAPSASASALLSRRSPSRQWPVP